ncbi:MAG TPA: enoyl-CoA hydratase-related protein [Acidimicrobiales bacterium]
MKSFETLLVDVDGGVATVTLNRPDAMNAFNLPMTAEFDEAIWSLEQDEAVRVIVLTGAGKAFSTGIDLASGGDTFGAEAHERHNAEVGASDSQITDRYSFWTMRTPMIAAINGMAIGAGLTLTFLADIRIVADDARLRLPFVRLNVLPDANSTWLLPRLVGLSRGLELLLSGRWFTGQEAADMGLASRAVPASDVLAVAQELAHDIATNTGPAAVGVTKQMVYRNLERTDRVAAFTEETKLTWWAGSQPDTVEGVTALMGRRAPQWTQSKHLPIPVDLQEM